MNVEWRRPKITETSGHRQASWIELFFDLVFIASLAESIHFVEAHLTDGLGHTLWLFAVMFTAPWIVWWGVTFYSDRYEENTIRHRLLIIVLMIPVGLFAYSIHYVVEGHYGWFVISFLFSRLWMMFMWGSVQTEGDKAHWHTIRIVLIGLGTSSVIVGVAYFVPDLFLELVTLALLIEMMHPLLGLRAHDQLPAFTVTHLPERFGLFTMLVLGEGVLGAISVFDADTSLLYPLLFFLLVVMSYWVYYDQVIYRLFHPTSWHIFWWGIWNWPIVVSLLLMRSSFYGVNAGEKEAETLLVLSGMFFLLTTALIGLVGKKGEADRRITRQFILVRLLIVCLLLASMFWLPFAATVFILIACYLVTIGQALYYWFYHFNDRSQ